MGANGDLFIGKHRALDLVREFGTPLQVFLPEVATKRTERVIKAFYDAIGEAKYPCPFTYFYPLKANQRKCLVEAVVAGGAQLETSSTNELALVRSLYQSTNRPRIICNGPKPDDYIELIETMYREGWDIVPIFNDEAELYRFANYPGAVGIRLDLEVKSRVGDWQKKHNYFGISEKRALSLPSMRKLVMIHYHLSSQMDQVDRVSIPVIRAIEVYAKLQKRHPNLHQLNIGGGAGLPYTKIPFYSTEEAAQRVVAAVRKTAEKLGIDPPTLMCEWGQHVVAPAQVTIFKVIRAKRIEKRAGAKFWYAIDGSFMSNLPDSWGITQAWHVTPIDRLDARTLVPVWFSGSTCDSGDQYPSENYKTGKRPKAPLLPLYKEGEDYYVAFFDTCAYQDPLGSNHCLLPRPARLLLRGSEKMLLQPRETTEDIGRRFGWA